MVILIVASCALFIGAIALLCNGHMNRNSIKMFLAVNMIMIASGVYTVNVLLFFGLVQMK